VEGGRREGAKKKTRKLKRGGKNWNNAKKDWGRKKNWERMGRDFGGGWGAHNGKGSKKGQAGNN